ncbi:MAG: AlpA family phage regulatory protein [Legionella sp.]
MHHTNIKELAQRVLFITDLEKILGRNRLTLRRWWMEGKFPRPVKLNGTTLVWHSETINQWIQQNIKEKEDMVC